MEFGEESCFEDLVFGGWCLRVGCARDALPFLMLRSQTSGKITDIRDQGILTDDCHPSTIPECKHLFIQACHLFTKCGQHHPP